MTAKQGEVNKPLSGIFENIGNRLGRSGTRAETKNWAQRFSNELALLISSEIRPSYPKARVTPNVDGSGQEFRIGGDLDSKRTDVSVWDDRAGLILGCSIKTLTTPDEKTKRYTKNVVRNDMELRDEADKLHRRQPYSYLVAIIFMPLDSTWDGRAKDPDSSFTHAVFSFRKRTGRDSADSLRHDRFEAVYIGLFEEDGSVGFFNVADIPRKNQPPETLISFRELIQEIVDGTNQRHLNLRSYKPDDPDWQRPIQS